MKKPIYHLILLLLGFIVTFQACDVMVQEDVVPEKLRVLQLNGQEIYTDINKPVEFNFLKNDSAKQTVTIKWKQPLQGQVKFDSSKAATPYIYIPAKDYSGSDTIKYVVCQGTVCDSSRVVVVIRPGGSNCTVSLNNDTAITRINTPVSVPVLLNDNTCGYKSSISVSKVPANGSVQIRDSVIIYTPRQSFTGTDSLQYRICKDNNTCYYGKVKITVSSTDTICTLNAVSDSYRVYAGTTSVLRVTDNDKRCGKTTLSVVQRPVNGIVTIDSLKLSYTSNPGFSGSDRIVYQICEGNKCSQATAWVTVTAKDSSSACTTPLQVNDDMYVIPFQIADSLLSVTDNDSICGTSIRVSIVNSPIYGRAEIENNKIRYYNPKQAGIIDELIYQVCTIQSGVTTCRQAKVRLRL